MSSPVGRATRSMQPSCCWWAVAPGPAICSLSQALRDCSPHRSSELKPCLHLNKSLCSPFRRGRGCYKVSSTNFKEVRVTPRRKTCLNPTEGSMGACGCHGGRGSPCWGTYVVLLPTWLMGLSSAEKTRESLVTEAGKGQDGKHSECLRKSAPVLVSQSAGVLGLMTKNSELELQRRFLPVYTFLLLEGPTAGQPPP